MNAVTSQSATQSAGHLYVPYSLSGTPSTSASSYNTGDVIDYQIFSYDSNPTYSAGYAIVQTVISGTGDDSILAWTENNSGTATISGYRIYRQINSGGFNDYIDIAP